MPVVNNYIGTDLGNVSLNPRGSYSNTNTYEYLDIVSYLGGSYICKATISGIAPVEGQNTEFWQMVSLPGGMTDEYIEAYEDTKRIENRINKAHEIIDDKKAEIETTAEEVQNNAEAANDAKEFSERVKASVEKTANDIVSTANAYTDTVAYEKADKTELHSHDNKRVLDGISAENVQSWNNKSEFDGDYEHLTNVPDLSVYAEKSNTAERLHTHSELHSHANAATLDNITAQKVTAWDAKSDFSGDYNDLENKPVIPSTPDEVGADPTGSADTALSDAKKYTDQKITDLIGGAPETLDTLKEIADVLNKDGSAISEINKTLGAKANKSDIPTTLPASDVSPWAKATTKPTYTASEVGALPANTYIPSIEGLATEEYVNTEVAKKAAKDHSHNELHTHSNKTILDGITSEKVTQWNNKSDFSGSYDDLTNKPGSELYVGNVEPTYNEAKIWVNENETNETTSAMVNLVNDVSEIKARMSDAQKLNLQFVYDVINDTPHAATIADYFKMKKNYNIYSVKIWLFSTNPTTSCDKLGLNASLNFTPSTDTVEGEDDYLNGEHTLFQWFNCNYIRQADGSPVVTATEFDDTFATTGSVDVGCVQMPFYIDIDKSHEDEGYHIMSISADRHILRTDYNFVPWSECVNASGEILPYTVGSKYMSGVGADGLPRSQPNLAIKNFESHNTIITNYGKKGEGYHGAGIERNTFQIIFTLIKAAQKSSQKVFMGCTNYNFQYNASVQSEESHTYFPVTNAQAANIVVGSTVSIGYAVNNNGTLNNDRGQATVRSYADKVKVLRIETLDENNKAVYLDVDTPFNTMPHVYSETLSAPIIISSMPWHSGSTDCVIGRHDGSMGSNTSGKYPYRVQGREYAVGTYFIPSDAVMIYGPDHGTKDVYICPKGSPRSTSDAVIRSTYDMIGRIPIVGENNSDWWIGDITFDLAHGASFPTGVGDSDAHGVGDRIYAGGANASGSREMLMGGHLWNGSAAGSSFVLCWHWLSWSHWHCAAAD